MRKSNAHIYLHLVWATWDRMPLIVGKAKEIVYESILRESAAMKCRVYAVGGVDDHVHILLSIPTTIEISRIIQRIKNQTSMLAGHGFKWQGSYGVISVTPRHIPLIAKYIQNQATHHYNRSVHPMWEPDS